MADEHQFWTDYGDTFTWTWTLPVLILIFLYRSFSSRFRATIFSSSSSSSTSKPRPRMTLQSPPLTPLPLLQNDALVTDSDLKYLLESFDEKSPLNAGVVWENVIDKSSSPLAYRAKFCKPKDGGPLKYLSVTTFEDCPVEVLLKFYMDNDYRMQWDKTVAQHEQLMLDQSSGVEIGRTVKKFPFLTPREYVLAWRIWQGMDGSYYCFNKECEHPLTPRQRKYVRAVVYRSGWRIRKLPDRNACEVMMVHQEDAGLNVDMAKIAFAKGIWSYVCKMNDALRRYSSGMQQQLNSTASALTFIQKVPTEFEMKNDVTSPVSPENSTRSIDHQVEICKRKKRKLTRQPSSKLIANGLILVGGVICLSRGHSSLGAKVALGYIISKLSKRGDSAKRMDNI